MCPWVGAWVGCMVAQSEVLEWGTEQRDSLAWNASTKRVRRVSRQGPGRWETGYIEGDCLNN